MSEVLFNDGVLKTSEKESAIFLTFSPMNADGEKNRAVLKSLPRIHGLRRQSHRQNYAFDFLQHLHKLGYEIKKREDNQS